MRDFRIFVSSPGDVAIERRRVDDVVSRLNGAFSELARFSTVRWETGFYRAHETYQTQIPPAADCDLVVGILKWRLGTPLPPDFSETLAGGEAYPSGTAYEILTAIEKRRSGATLPDVFVFRYAASAPQLVLGDPQEDVVRREWEALCGFIGRWFETPSGQFLAAFNPYTSEDDFEKQLETLLRDWCGEKISGGEARPWPAARGSPFRGLDVFDTAHAPVFFGRREDTGRAIDSWRKAAAGGTPFLLLVGASGAGKSSLARAGLLPRLTTAGVIAEVDLWRIAIMRPGDVADDPVAALAAALAAAEPEILAGDFPTIADLAAALGGLAGAAAQPVLRALDRAADRMRVQNHSERAHHSAFVVLVDQLEELFAASVAAPAREGFVALLATLVASRRVWLVATLRADVYSRLIEEPSLKRLKDAGASLDIAAPTAAQMAEIVRGPAEAAGLTFECAPDGERLDERLLAEADRPDMLPLVQLALTRLWEMRSEADGMTILRWQAYDGMGGLRGIIEEAGERALQPLADDERRRLPALVHRLAERAGIGTVGAAVLTTRAASLVQAAPDPGARRLADALVAARLLTISDTGESAQVRFAHHRVLSDWARVREIVAKDADFFRIRDETETQRRRWEAAGRRSELLLARGLPLAEAESLRNRHAGEMPPETLAFVQASRRRADRGKLMGWAAAGLFALLTVAAAWQWRVAADQRELAARNFAAAKGAVDGLIFDVAQGLRDVAGMRVDTTRKILDTVKATVDKLVARAPDDAGLRRSRAAMLNNFVVTYLRAGDTKAALAAAAESLATFRALAAAAPDDLDARRDIAIGLTQLGDAKLRSGDQAGALAAFEEDVVLDRALLARNPSDRRANNDLIVGLERIGDVQLQRGDPIKALAAFREALAVSRTLAERDPRDREARRDITLHLDRIGDIELDASKLNEALAHFDEGLAIRRRLLAAEPGDARAQRDVTLSLERIGKAKLLANDKAGALSARTEELALRRRLATQDPGSLDAQRDLAVTLVSIGDARILSGDSQGALASYEEALATARALVAKDPDDARAERDLVVLLNKIGGTQALLGKKEDSARTFDESLSIARRLAIENRDDGDAQSNLAQALGGSADVKLLRKDASGALPLILEAVAVTRKEAARQGSVAMRRNLGANLLKLGTARQALGDRSGAHAAFQEALDIARANAAQNPDDRRNQLDLAAKLMAITATDAHPRDRMREIVTVLERLEAEGVLTGSERDVLAMVKRTLAADDRK